MQKIGFIFPGQGSQKLGMLSEIASKSGIIKSTFAEASEVLGLDLWEASQTDERNVLNRTEVTQPALLAASISIWRVWQERTNIVPTVLAGHSLGEYSALVCAQSIEYSDAINLVHKRGKMMQAAVPEGDGKMAAILGLSPEEISNFCSAVAAESGTVSPANFNSPAQTVIAGEAEPVNKVIDLCKSAGAKRALLLSVSVPSHCELMRSAAEEFEKELSSVNIRSPSIPVLQNVNGRKEESPEQIKNNLVKQLYSPVLWVDCVEGMCREGASIFVECGPGKILSGLVKRIEPTIKCYGSDGEEAIETILTELAELAP